MKYLMIAGMIATAGCAVMRPIQDCKALCAGQKVQYFKDESMECKCCAPESEKEKEQPK